MKYRPTFLTHPFDTVSITREWVDSFVQRYNYENRHSGLNFVTPNERHTVMDQDILSRRKTVYLAAMERQPERWSGNIRNWDLPEGRDDSNV